MKHLNRPLHRSTLCPLSLLVAGAIALPARAEPVEPVLPEIRVIVSAIADSYRLRQNGVSDSAQLLAATPGYSVAQAGGLSGLPVANGLGDDRLKIRSDGMEITSACANHMNAPLSYIDPVQVGRIKLVAGVTPVSLGGDSIGGSITVSSPEPVFGAAGEGLHTEGQLTASARSVNNAVAGGVSASVASENLSFGYSGAYARGQSYTDGAGRPVLASMYESINQAVVLALRGADQQLTLRAGKQHIPYQGFPNQYMDMTDNQGQFGNASYHGRFGWGELDANAYWQQTEHEMGFFSPERTGSMPMVTSGRNRGYALKASLPLWQDGQLRLGQEYHGFRLDDYWPAVPGSMMMGPQTYLNINDGRRDRWVLFGELEAKPAAGWEAVLGARWERVDMATGAVQPYARNMMNAADAAAATAFNARSRDKRDNNLDLSLMARHVASPGASYEWAVARKTRSPNLYERYSWGRGTMAMTMTNWFGDGNGYVGNIDLKPETAYTAGFTADWHGSDGAGWFLRLSPYFSRVQDYIDTDLLGSFHPYMQMMANGNLLRFANHDAKLYGANLSGRMPLPSAGALGALHLSGSAAYTRGRRIDGGELYHMMPFNAQLALEQAGGRWSSQLEARYVARKGKVDAQRLEPVTGGYTLFNARASYLVAKAGRLSVGVSNLLDKRYADPLGGVYLSGLRAAGGALQPLPGYGRSFDLGLTVAF